MKKIEVVAVENGYVISVTTEGVQTIYEQEHSLVAKTKEGVMEIIEKELE